MKILRLNETPKAPFALNGHILAHLPNVEVVHLNLKPGEKIEKHVNPMDVIFFVLEGKAMFETDNERVLVLKDQCIHIEGGKNRGFDNISISPFKVLVIKTKQA
ncbi:MAG: cupin domain-containing protein [Lentimicrobium sp.]|nr:cupin domain-containing protein [Lentimicrobium sp.]